MLLTRRVMAMAAGVILAAVIVISPAARAEARAQSHSTSVPFPQWTVGSGS